MKEEWRDVVGYEGIYQVSNTGLVRSSPGKITVRSDGQKRVWDTRILKQKFQEKPGYQVTLWKDGKPKMFQVARLVATAFLGEPAHPSMTVNHKDGSRKNNYADNLEWLTRADNIRHAFDTGLMPYDRVTIKVGDEVHDFRSLNEASTFIGRGKGYISSCNKRNKIPQDKYGNPVEIISALSEDKGDVRDV